MLFEEECSLDSEEPQETNVYLADPKKGISLVNSLLCRKEVSKTSVSFDAGITEKILPVLAKWDFGRELEPKFVTMMKLMEDQLNMAFLGQRKVLGVGGAFSSGKSCFVNSITNAHLPVDQMPVTSIATYVISADIRCNAAVLNNNTRIALDDEAVAAITHRFYDTYGIGFSKIIKNLIVYTPDFAYSNIAVLDTPGYNKSDFYKSSENSDAELAREQLRSADYLIWLIDAVQGTLTEKDREFLSSLNVNTEMLVIFTKADCVQYDDLNKKVNRIKEIFESDKIYDVIAYNSRKKKTVIGEGVLDAFLSMIDHSVIKKDTIRKQFRELQNVVKRQFSLSKADLKAEYKRLQNRLENAEDVRHISAAVTEYGRCRSQLLKLKDDEESLADELSRLDQMLQSAKLQI